MSDETNPSDGLSPDQIDVLAGLALNPKEGDTFTLAGREFTRAFLRIDAEDALTGIIVEVVKDAAGQDLATMFLLALPKLRAAAAVILADTAPEPFDAAAWLAETRGVTNMALLDLVLAQVQLQELGVLLGKLLTASGLLAAVTGRSVPSLPPTSAA